MSEISVIFLFKQTVLQIVKYSKTLFERRIRISSLPVQTESHIPPDSVKPGFILSGYVLRIFTPKLILLISPSCRKPKRAF
jgi:hypothetical protein